MKQISILFLALFVFLFGGGVAFAQSEELKTAKQGVVDSVSALSDIQENAELSDAEKEAQEAEARKIALKKIFELSQLELKTLTQKVSAVKELSVEYIELQNQLIKNLGEASADIHEYADTLTELMALPDVKQFAADFKEWRETKYNVAIHNALDFISVFQAQTFLKIAEARFEKIATDLRRLRSSKIVKTETLEPLLSWAGQDLKEARAQYAQAVTLLLETKPDKPSVGVLVDALVANIKDAYKRFFEMSDLVRKMVKPS